MSADTGSERGLALPPQEAGHCGKEAIVPIAFVSAEMVWSSLGFLGQAVFGSRFVLQWIATERQKKSVMPVAFWYLSVIGTVILLSYSIYRQDPVFIAGFSLNMIIYLRNLYFIHIHPRKVARSQRSQAGEDS